MEVADDWVEVVRISETHKYLGSAFPGNLAKRERIMPAHRIKCVWAKFHYLHGSLTNKYVGTKLKLHWFDAVVTPCALYGLTTALLTAADVEHLAAIHIDIQKAIRPRRACRQKVRKTSTYVEHLAATQR